MAEDGPGAVAAVLPSTEQPIRAAEVVGALSLATDLGTGQPLEHALRTAVLAVRLGELAGASAQELVDLSEVLRAAGDLAGAEAALEQAINLNDEKGNVVAAQQCRERLTSLRAVG